MPGYTISEAARLCGVNRRTLQRAIQAGRLLLTVEHLVDIADLRRAGYSVPVSQLDHRSCNAAGRAAGTASGDGPVGPPGAAHTYHPCPASGGHSPPRGSATDAAEAPRFRTA